MKNINNFDEFMGESKDNNLKLFLHKKQIQKAAREKKASIKAAELSKVELNDAEIKEILLAVKSGKYDFSKNLDKSRKLQSMGLLKAPNTIQAQSSYNKLFYITDKGLKLINDK